MVLLERFSISFKIHCMEKKLTKKEKRLLAKKIKKEKQEAIKMRKKIQQVMTWVIGVFVISLIGYNVYKWITKPAPQVAGEATEYVQGDWVKGNKDAGNILIEYSDFQCPACAFYAPTLKRIDEDFGEKIKIVYRHFPLISIHKNAFLAARASEAAGIQGKFWEMHDLLFETQKDWENDTRAKDKFISYALELGLNEDKFIKDFESDEVEDSINQDVFYTGSLRLNSTPSFVLNGKVLTSIDGPQKLFEEVENLFNTKE